MNLDDYVIRPLLDRHAFEYVYVPTGKILLTTQHVSVTTLLRIATAHNIERLK